MLLLWIDKSERYDNLWRQDEFSNAGKQLRLKNEAPPSFSTHKSSRLSRKKIQLMRCPNLSCKNRKKKKGPLKIRKGTISEDDIWIQKRLGRKQNYISAGICLYYNDPLKYGTCSPFSACHGTTQARYIHTVTKAYSPQWPGKVNFRWEL